MEEKVKELEHKVEVLTSVVFIILKETGLLEKALISENIEEAVKKATEERRTQKDKFKSTHKEGEHNSILEEFDSKEAIKN